MLPSFCRLDEHATSLGKPQWEQMYVSGEWPKTLTVKSHFTPNGLCLFGRELSCGNTEIFLAWIPTERLLWDEVRSH